MIVMSTTFPYKVTNHTSQIVVKSDFKTPAVGFHYIPNQFSPEFYSSYNYILILCLN